MGAGVPEELENDPYNILSELFAIIPDINEGNYAKIFRIPGLRELVLKLTGFDINNALKSMMRTMPKMLNMAFRKYVLPIMKGDGKMSKKKMAGFPKFPMPPMPPVMPMFPMWDASDWDWDEWDWSWDWDEEGWDWDSQKEKADEKSQEFKADFKTYWEKAIDVQKSSIDSSKEQFEQFFEYMMGMQDDFVEFLPEELPWMPSWAKAPKAVRKQMKEFQKMANEYFVAQTDTWADFWIECQEKACEQIPNAPESAEETEEVVEVKAVEEKKQTKAAATKQATAKPAAAKQSTAKPAAAKQSTAKATTAAKTTAAKDAKTTK